MVIRQVDDLKSIYGYDPVERDAIDKITGALIIRCTICGRRAWVGRNTSVKRWAKVNHWRYVHKADNHLNEGWVCYLCSDKIVGA